MLTSQEEAGKLDSINVGTASAILNNTADSPLTKLLKDLMQGVIDEITANLDKYDANASRRLRQSFKPTPVTIEGGTIVAGIQVDEQQYYWKFVNKGVNGTETNWGAPSWSGYTAPPGDYKSSINEWIRDKGITADNGNYDSLAFLIMRNLKKHGQKPKPFFDDVMNDPQLINYLKKPIEKLLGQAITVSIARPWQ